MWTCYLLPGRRQGAGDAPIPVHVHARGGGLLSRVGFGHPFARQFPSSIARKINQYFNQSTQQVDDGDEGDLLKQALAMSMTDGEEFENLRVRF